MGGGRLQNGVQNAPYAMAITIEHVRLMSCTIGGALKQKVQNFWFNANIISLYLLFI